MWLRAGAQHASGVLRKPSVCRLDAGQIESLVAELGMFPTSDRKVEEQIRIEAEYFSHNAQRMRYSTLRKQHLFMGSGVIKAGCKTIIGSRLKHFGMFWTLRGANAILAPAQTASVGGSDKTRRTASGPHDLHNYVAHPFAQCNHFDWCD